MMHYGYNGGSNDPHWGALILLIVMLAVLAAVLAAVVVLIVKFVRQSEHRSQPHPPPPPAASSSPDALRILDERLARGEIDGDDYRNRRSLLKDDQG